MSYSPTEWVPMSNWMDIRSLTILFKVKNPQKNNWKVMGRVQLQQVKNWMTSMIYIINKREHEWGIKSWMEYITHLSKIWWCVQKQTFGSLASTTFPDITNPDTPKKTHSPRITYRIAQFHFTGPFHCSPSERCWKPVVPLYFNNPQYTS
jgi:hypothetical protein